MVDGVLVPNSSHALPWVSAVLPAKTGPANPCPASAGVSHAARLGQWDTGGHAVSGAFTIPN